MRHHFRRWLEGKGQALVVGVLPAQVVEHDGRRQRARALVESLPEAWVRRSAGEGSQGARIHDWACVALSEEAPDGMGRWLLDPASPGKSLMWRFIPLLT